MKNLQIGDLVFFGPIHVQKVLGRIIEEPLILNPTPETVYYFNKDVRIQIICKNCKIEKDENGSVRLKLPFNFFLRNYREEDRSFSCYKDLVIPLQVLQEKLTKAS